MSVSPKAVATGSQYIEQKIIVPRKDATIRKIFHHVLHVAEITGAVLYPDNNFRIGGAEFLIQSERDQHP